MPTPREQAKARFEALVADLDDNGLLRSFREYGTERRHGITLSGVIRHLGKELQVNVPSTISTSRGNGPWKFKYTDWDGTPKEKSETENSRNRAVPFDAILGAMRLIKEKHADAVLLGWRIMRTTRRESRNLRLYWTTELRQGRYTIVGIELNLKSLKLEAETLHRDGSTGETYQTFMGRPDDRKPGHQYILHRPSEFYEQMPPTDGAPDGEQFDPKQHTSLIVQGLVDKAYEAFTTQQTARTLDDGRVDYGMLELGKLAALVGITPARKPSFDTSTGPKYHYSDKEYALVQGLKSDSRFSVHESRGPGGGYKISVVKAPPSESAPVGPDAGEHSIQVRVDEVEHEGDEEHAVQAIQALPMVTGVEVTSRAYLSFDSWDDNDDDEMDDESVTLRVTYTGSTPALHDAILAVAETAELQKYNTHEIRKDNEGGRWLKHEGKWRKDDMQGGFGSVKLTDEQLNEHLAGKPLLDIVHGR